MALTTSKQTIKRGDKAIDFSLEGVDGKIYSLADFQGKEGLLVMFMCNHCPYVIAKMPAIIDLHKQFGDRIDVVGINSNDPAYPGEGMENMKAFAAEHGMGFPYLLDDTQSTAKAYGATCTPDPFLFGKDHRLVFHGRINDEMQPGDPVSEHTMADVMEKLLAGEEIGDEAKHSMGCSIKWISSDA